MADGIRINDASAEISSEALRGLVTGRGGGVTLNKLDISVSPEGLAALLQGLAPEGTPAPVVQVGEGALHVEAQREGKPMALDLNAGSIRLQFTAEGLRLTTE